MVSNARCRDGLECQSHDELMEQKGILIYYNIGSSPGATNYVSREPPDLVRCHPDI